MPFLTDTYVLFVGGRAGYKNFQLVVDAIFETSLNLVIVGGLLTGKERFYLEEKLGSRYKYVGNISNIQLNILYNNAFVYYILLHMRGSVFLLLKHKKQVVQ